MKSFSNLTRQDTKRILNFLIILCLMFSICILSTFKVQYCSATNDYKRFGTMRGMPSDFSGKHLAPLKLELAKHTEGNNLTEESRKLSLEEEDKEEDEDDEVNFAIHPQKPICQESSKRSDTCDARGDIRVEGRSNTVFVSSTQQEWKIKPYARKGDAGALSHVSEWSLKPLNRQISNCTFKETVPAVIFSINGYTGNIFHDFTDVLIPLFISSHQFNGQVQFLVTDTKPWWINKYRVILKQLSSYEIIDLEINGEAIRCFPRAIIGLPFHKELGVDPAKSPKGYSIADFKVLLRKAYRLERADVMSSRRPTILIISRKRSRAFVDEKGMAEMAERLGFDVRAAEADMRTDIAKFARLVNWADVMVGVHGAGLTNLLFLPAGAVVIQIVPFGGLDWLARETFGNSIDDLGLHYLEYGIGMEETTLVEQYSRDHRVLRDPPSVRKLGWNAIKEIYLERQNVKPDLGRLKGTFFEALKLLPK